MPAVTLEQVSKTYPRGPTALDAVSLRIEDGELAVLVGPSGSGKTTLLRLIAGLETPSHGTIRIGGVIVNNVPPHRRDVAMVFQRPALYPHQSVRDNLTFGLKLRGVSAAERDRRAAEAASLLQLESLLERRPATLSGGQQQRVALGRALVREPAVFLFDEPLSNLDARLRLEMRRELHLLHRRLRATMIYVTHDQDEAMTLGERVVVLDQGRIRQTDPPRVLYERPNDRFVAGFLGWPSMNLLDGTLTEWEGRLRFGTEDACLLTADRPDWRSFVNRPLLLGIRPEDVRPAEGPGEGRLEMKVCVVERPGSSSLATLSAASWTVTARLAVPSRWQEGDRVWAAFELTRAHLFNPATGRALCHGLGERGA